MPSVDEDVRLVELAYIFDRNTKRTITLENSLVIPYKHTLSTSQQFTSRDLPREKKYSA